MKEYTRKSKKSTFIKKRNRLTKKNLVFILTQKKEKNKYKNM